MKQEVQDSILIAYILDTIDKITDLSSDVNFKERLFSEWVTHDAVLHRLQTLAESSKKMAGFRNIIVHQYLGDIDPEILWNVITQQLPQLRKALLKYRDKR